MGEGRGDETYLPSLHTKEPRNWVSHLNAGKLLLAQLVTAQQLLLFVIRQQDVVGNLHHSATQHHK